MTACSRRFSDPDFFEAFTAEQFLKEYDLSHNQIDSGLIGGTGDGGIDGFYLFVNGDLHDEDVLHYTPPRGASLDLCMLQSKMGRGFQETPVERFLTVSANILNLDVDVESLHNIYNSALVSAIQRFRDVYSHLVTSFPDFRIRYGYACKAADSPRSPIKRKVDKLNNLVTHLFPDARFQFDFLGAPALLALARRAPQASYTLQLAENPISSRGAVGFLCLVRLSDFYQFITDENGRLRRRIFEANVRDFQGSTEVNKEIMNSLDAASGEDFWWLNNGISIVATRASLGGKELTLEDPEIVNGLQTSTQIHSFLADSSAGTDRRHVLVKILVPIDSGSRDRIIKATNRQTAVHLASLRSTDDIHRDIEEYFMGRGLWYDRRKNYYKNRGKARDEIVSISYLAQSMMAIVLKRPDTARARPSSLLKRDVDYTRVFDPSHPIALYYVCAESMRRVERFLREEAKLPPKDRTNLRFFVGTHAVLSALRSRTPRIGALASFDLRLLDAARIESSCTHVRLEYDRLGGTDRVAKGPTLRAAVLDDIAKNHGPATKTS